MSFTPAVDAETTHECDGNMALFRLSRASTGPAAPPIIRAAMGPPHFLRLAARPRAPGCPRTIA